MERSAEGKSEYFDGEVFAMAGGTERHSLVATNVTAELRGALRKAGKDCRTYNSDLRVQIPQTQLRTYPDASVICGPAEFDAEDEEKTTVSNPTVLVEVLSPSTESYDRGKKFQHYQTLASLQEYVIVSQAEPKVETFLRQANGTWRYTCVTGLGVSIALESLGIEVLMDEIYAGVVFDESPTLRLVK